MIPLVDLHCHLLAGLDDGPRTEEDALAMCRMACEEGVQVASALAHQNERWPSVTPDRIRQAAARLAQLLKETRVSLAVFPCAEVMVRVDIEPLWRQGEILSVADRREYILLEMPHGLFVDLRPTVRDLVKAGVRPILAHPERSPELLHEPGTVEELIQVGSLVQVSSGSVTDPPSGRDGQALKDWFKRGIVHFMGSDGHSPRRRQPKMADAYRQVSRWTGNALADRVFSTNGMAIVYGLPLHISKPDPRPTRSFWKFW